MSVHTPAIVDRNQRAPAESDGLAARILVRALQDASEKDDAVWAFTR
jgi:hypothetical protein